MSEAPCQQKSTTGHGWKRYLRYKDSGVEWLGEIPEGWNINRLKYISKLESGQRESVETDIVEKYAFSLGGEHIGWMGDLHLSNERYISKKFFDSLKTGHILRKDIVLVKDGATIGKSAIIQELPFENIAVNEHVFILRPYSSNISPEFLFYLIISRIVQEQILQLIRGAAQPGLNSNFSEFVFVSLPFEKNEQNSITNFLDRETARIDTLITNKVSQISRLNEKRAAIISHAVTMGLDPSLKMKNSKIEWIAQIPSHWNEMKAKDLYRQLFLPPQPKGGIVTVFRDGQVTLRENRRTEGFTNAILEVGYQSVRNGDLVIHSMDAFAGAIGVSDSDGKCTGEYVVCEPIFSDVNNFYYGLFLREMALAKYILAICPSVRERAPRFRFNTFKEVILPVPPIEEQNEIVAYIGKETRNIDIIRERVQRSIELLKEYRSALISAAVTGKIDVREEVHA
jgi:type I restriction enzyme, S subunit